MKHIRLVLTIVLVALAGFAQAEPTGGLITKPTGGMISPVGF